MIDFRYHVVSITAVFLALAVGVVLGSGPLRTALVSELTNQTTELQTALDASQAQTATAIQTGKVGEEFVSEASSVLIGGALTDRHVAIIRIFEPDGAEVTGLRDRIGEAGGQVTANLSILPNWTDDGQMAFRAAFAAQVVDSVVGVDVAVAPDRVLAHALAQALVPTEPPNPDGTATAETTTTTDTTTSANTGDRAPVLLDLLEGAELISGTVTGEVDTVIFVVGLGPNNEDDLALVSDVYSELVGIMDGYVGGTIVVTGPARSGDITAAIQASVLLQDNVSTVVDGVNFYGAFTVVLGLAQEVAGTSGHYGFGDDLLLYPGRVATP